MDKTVLIKRIRELSDPLTPNPTDESPILKPIYGIGCVAFDFYGTMYISGVGDIGVDSIENETNIELFEDALYDSGFELQRDNTVPKGLERFEQSVRKYQNSRRNEGIDYPEPDIVEIWFEVLESLIKESRLTGKLTRKTARRFALEYEFRFNPIWPMPDLTQTINELKEKRFILGIISNSQFYTPLAFEALSGESLEQAGFDKDLLNWSYRASVKKPSPYFYKRFVKMLYQKHQMKPESVLYVGNDMLKDIKPASEVGMKTALFAGDRRSLRLRKDEPSCEEVEPDLVITRLGQLSDCLQTEVKA